MRHDKKIDPTLGLSDRQTFFVNAWFNMVHKSSLDSNRVRVMNPQNILREFRKMYEAHADDGDRKIVAEEAGEIFSKHPVFEQYRTHYPALDDAMALLADAVSKSKKEAKTDPATGAAEKQENIFKKNAGLIHSFVNELEASLKSHFLADCFTWLDERLSAVPVAGETAEARQVLFQGMERVSRDILSVAHDEGFSLETLYQLHRIIAPARGNNTGYVFAERFTRVKGILMDKPRPFRVIFAISRVTTKASQVTGKYGDIVISERVDDLPPDPPERVNSFFSARGQTVYADITVKGRDGRSAGMAAYWQINQILDLMRFEYDAKNVFIGDRFYLLDEDKQMVLDLPRLIPNPEADPPTRRFEDFVEHLNGLAGRDGTQAESKDRIFSAFRLYRVGTDVTIFENKLVNWWTAIEYLAKGAKVGGAIGPSVVSALAPTLGLVYLPKHLTAYRNMLAGIGVTVQVDGQAVPVQGLSNTQMYGVLKDAAQRPALEQACSAHPYLWHHLSAFMDGLGTAVQVATALKSHEKRLRWQIDRIYRARCDIVHSGQQVVMASLLCANLEYYLRMTLKSMLRSFHEISTLCGPSEFFERRRHLYARVVLQLEKPPPTDALLLGTLND